MTPVKYMLAAWILALAPSMGNAQESQRELSEALFIAAHIGHMPSIMDLVQRGANVNYLNRDRESPMHAAAARGHLRVMQYLKNQRANLHPRTIENWIPLHHAVRFGHQHVVNFLMANGAPIYMRTRTGQTVFDIAEGIRDTRMLNLLERYRR